MHPANADLRTGLKGIALAKEFEGWYSRAYRDPAGVWTIGWGTTNEGPNGRVVWPGRQITKKQGEEYLRNDLLESERYVKHYVKVPLTQHQFEALVLFVYNVGAGNFRKSSVLKMLNRGNYDAVPGLMLRYNTARNRKTGKRKVYAGLTRRRKAEGVLFMTGDTVYDRKDFAPERDIDGEYMGPESAIIPTDIEPQENALMDTLTSDTSKSQLITWAGLLSTLAAAIEPITRNPVLFIGLAVAVVGLGLAAYIKYRDTREGR